jgi:hypothetical protein
MIVAYYMVDSTGIALPNIGTRFIMLTFITFEIPSAIGDGKFLIGTTCII